MRLVALMIAGFLSFAHAAAEERIIPVVQLLGSMDGEDGEHPAMYFAYGRLDFRLDVSDRTRSEAFDRLTVFVPQVGGATNHRAHSSLRVSAGESFDPHQVHISEDGSILILSVAAPGGTRWLFVDTATVEPIGELMASRVIIEEGQLS